MEATDQVNSVFREKGLGFVFCDTRVHYDVLTLLPVYRGSNTILVADLKGWFEFGKLSDIMYTDTYNRSPWMNGVR